MGAEGHVEHAQTHIHVFAVDINAFLLVENTVADGAWTLVARDDEGVLLRSSPLLEGLKGVACIHHARGGKQKHGAFSFDGGSVELLAVLEVEHIGLDEGSADLLIGPIDKQFIVEVQLLYHPSTEVDGIC